MRRRVAKFLLAAGMLLLILLCAIIALPLWLPWIARPFLARSGVGYSQFERESYSAFVLHNVAYTNANLRLTAERVRILAPQAWFWKLRIQKERVRPYVQVQNWHVWLDTARHQAKPAARHDSRSRAKPGQEWTETLEAINRWIPSARLKNGTVDLGRNELLFPSLSWANSQLAGKASSQKAPDYSAEFTASVREQPYVARLRSEKAAAELNLQLATNVAGYKLTGTGTWRTNNFHLEAEFPSQGFIPDRASITAANFALPREVFPLPDYDLLRGDLLLRWEEQKFKLHVDGHAPALRPDLPAVAMILDLEGTTNSVIVRNAEITSPGIKARLTRNVPLIPKPPWLAEPAQLFVTADFDRLQLLPLTGTARANVFVSPASGAFPSVTFVLAGSNIVHRELTLGSLDVEGALEWPELHISRMRTELWPGCRLTAQGSCNLSNQVIARATCEATLSKPPPFLPRGITWSTLTFSATGDGPFRAPHHSGKLRTTGLQVRGATLDALNASWQGTLTDLEQLSVSAQAKDRHLDVSGAFNWKTNLLSARLDQLALTETNEPVLALTRPARASFVPARPGHPWSANTEPIVFSGPVGKLEFSGEASWPGSGRIELSAAGLRSAMLREFVRLPEGNVESLAFAGSWSNSPVVFKLAAEAEALYTNIPMRLELAISGDSAGLDIGKAILSVTNTPLVHATGHLPVVLDPRATNPIVIDTTGRLQASAIAAESGLLWNEVMKLARWNVQTPQLSAELSGTWAAPQGVVRFQTARLQPVSTNRTLPSLGPLDITLRAERGKFFIDPLSLHVQGQPLKLTAQLPADWATRQFFRKMPDWTKVSAQLNVPPAAIAAFEPLAPKIIAPEGQFEADLSLRPGLKLDGRLAVSGARTVSIGTLGPIRDINLRLAFEEGEAVVQSGRARIGGSPVTIQGQGRIDVTNRFSLPPFRLTIHGEKVPLSRQPEAIIRANLDLVLVNTNNVPLLAGNANIVDSYYLSDLSDLIPGKVANPRQRPPYFSIEDKPLAGIRLDLHVGGERGLRVRTPIAAGETTPNFHLTGTLLEPIAVGDLRVDSGYVRFPFGSLQVQQGLLTATTQDPQHPTVTLNATARQYGYDIRLDVSGRVNEPVLQFSSTPALSSDQILMMLTAGELPRGNVTLSPQQRAQTFAMFLGRDLLAKLGIGEQGGERLVVRSGEEFSEEGRPTYDVEYKLTDRWSVTGEYDRFGDFNAGVKWRVYSK